MHWWSVSYGEIREWEGIAPEVASWKSDCQGIERIAAGHPTRVVGLPDLDHRCG